MYIIIQNKNKIYLKIEGHRIQIPYAKRITYLVIQTRAFVEMSMTLY